MEWGEGESDLPIPKHQLPAAMRAVTHVQRVQRESRRYLTSGPLLAAPEVC